MSAVVRWALVAVVLATALAASLLVVVPATSVSYVDWSHPNHVEWRMQDGERVVDDEGKGKVSIDYSDGVGQNLDHFYDKLNFPWHPSITEIILISIGLGLLFLVLLNVYGFFYDEAPDPEHFLWIAAGFQVLIWFLVWGINFAVTGGGTNFTPDIQRVTSDPELVKAAVEVSKEYAGSRGMVGIGLSIGSMAALDAIVLAIAGSIYGLASTVRTKLGRYLYEGIPGSLRYGTILALDDDGIALYDAHVENKLGFLPTLAGRRVGRLSMERFTNVLVGDVKRGMVDRFRYGLELPLWDGLRSVDGQVARDYGEQVLAGLQRNSIPILREAQRRNGNEIVAATELLQTTSDQTLGRFQQDIVAGIGDLINTSFIEFRRVVREKLSAVLLGGLLEARGVGQEEVYPDGVRFLFSKGDTTVVVAEEKPQVRTVLFDSAFLEQEHVRLEEDDVGVQLAFPYIIFVMFFRRGRFGGLYVFYRNEPLKRLDDLLFRPNLPNTDDIGRICFGYDDPGAGRNTTLGEKVEAVISHFWQSYFNNHMIEYNFTPSKLLDKRLDGIWRWKEASAEDPFFVLRINWLRCELSLKRLILEFTRDALQDTYGQVETVINEALNAGNARVAELVEEYCRNIKVEGRYSRTVEEALKERLLGLRSELYNIVIEQLQELSQRGTVNGVDMVNAIQLAVSGILNENLDRVAEETDIPLRVDPWDVHSRLRRAMQAEVRR